MGTSQNFDDIRPYNDDEVQYALRKLTDQPQFTQILSNIFPNQSTEKTIELLHSFDSIKRFQEDFTCFVVRNVIAKTTNGYFISGLEKIEGSSNRLFISNHRDILLDSVFLNVLLVDNKRETTEIAIGDNLFVQPWIETLVRVNKSIVVKRNVPVRQMLEVSSHLSAYLRHVITEKKQSIWLAQREGRSKDSNDRTQDSLLKMLNMSGEASLAENMKELNITPIAISYEYDPCDYLKAKEFQLKRDDPNYKKAPQDDATNMVTGLRGWKGKIQFNIANIDNEIQSISEKGTKNEQITALAQLIDKNIHKNYEIYAGNMIALDLLEEKTNFVSKYTKEEKIAFEKYLQGQLDKIDIPNKDNAFLRHKILEMYANPLINHLKSI
jgi:1-acyl-sn-glycerol-3-phosphate acyltransferase